MMTIFLLHVLLIILGGTRMHRLGKINKHHCCSMLLFLFS